MQQVVVLLGCKELRHAKILRVTGLDDLRQVAQEGCERLAAGVPEHQVVPRWPAPVEHRHRHEGHRLPGLAFLGCLGLHPLRDLRGRNEFVA